MGESKVQEWARQYVKLKQQKNELEQELNELRSRMIHYCDQHQLSEYEAGNYRIKLVRQERKNYDDQKLYEALPDPDLWRLVSRTDPAKVNSLLKLEVLKSEMLKDTYHTKQVTLLQVENKE